MNVTSYRLLMLYTQAIHHTYAGNSKPTSPQYFLIDSSDSYVAVFGSKTELCDLNNLL